MFKKEKQSCFICKEIRRSKLGYVRKRKQRCFIFKEIQAWLMIMFVRRSRVVSFVRRSIVVTSVRRSSHGYNCKEIQRGYI